MKENKLKAVATDNSKPRDPRSHNEKIDGLREAFGRRKELAKQSGKVNDCSITKICRDVKVDKLWLLGQREYKKSPAVNEAYKKLRDDINGFRSNFKSDHDISEDKQRINELEQKYNNLLRSVEYRFRAADALEQKLKRYNAAAEQIEDKSTQLILKNIELEDKLTDTDYISESSAFISGKRTIISPDSYRTINGRYVSGDNKADNHAWASALDELNKAFSRKLPMRLYILVGLPCSGKTTWANDPNSYIENDRHPIIFDATNIKVIDRINLVHPIKCANPKLPVVCVYFDTAMEIIRRCNTERDGIDSAKLTTHKISSLRDKLEQPNPYEEAWIDDLRIVRRK
jgi:hypothetical protein